MVKPKNQILDFPLITVVNNAKNTLINPYNDSILGNYIYELPDYIKNNLSHNLREYQYQALENFNYSQEYLTPCPRHMLFNMATGSGKTDLMAALILYLYHEKGFQNFVFTVNTNSVLMKTRDNLINSKSDKYLYKQKIEIYGEILKIESVESFPRFPQKNTIYIKLATVQKISDDLFNIKEGKMGLSNYSENPVAVLADEAHHYSASTKSEKQAENTWEYAINKIVNARNDQDQKNILLEFTATIDLEKKEIFEKYQNKIVYRYPLDTFMKDGYSKMVKRIETSTNDKDKMLNAVLLSQFRKHFAKQEGVQDNFKPIIMFKAAKIEVSLKATKIFNELIDNLTVQNLLDFIKKQQLLDNNTSSALQLAYKYYLENELSLTNIISEIKYDFNPRNILNVNDKNKNILEKGHYTALNTLEHPNNFYRVVFAVAKLTEGWDVLNLYDIVRISEDAGTNSKSTMVEAQLVGRGARYYPFKFKGSMSYKRRFDSDPSHKQLLLETLHYHTINEPQYLKQLVNSFNQLGLPTEKDQKNPPIQVTLKSKFKQTSTYKNGKIYYNEVVKVPPTYFNSLDKYGINHKENLQRSINYGSREVEYTSISQENPTKTIYISRFDYRYIKKALQKIEFYQFNNLKKYIPMLNSITEFIYEEHWLNANKLKLFINVPIHYNEEDIMDDEILKVTIELLKEYQVKIQSGFVKERGTNKFIGYPIKDYLTDYKKRIPQYDTSNLVTRQNIQVYEMKNKDFYVYDKAIVNNLEYELIERIYAQIDLLKEKYDKAVYLFRMDENMHRESIKSEKLKLHQYGNPIKKDGSPSDIYLSGFQPDFILFLEDNENFHFQIFIEPKGMSGERYAKELWKEELLNYITTNSGEIVFADDTSNVSIKGLKFYNLNDGQETVKQLKEIVGIEKDVTDISNKASSLFDFEF